MNSIKAAIEAKKRKVTEETPATKKYVRRGDVVTSKHDDNAAAAATTTDDNVAEEQETKATTVVAVESNDVGEPPLNVAGEKYVTPGIFADFLCVCVSAVVRRLRSMGEPATMFAETPWQRYRRFRQVEASRAHHVDKLDGVQEDDFGAAMRALANQEKDAKVDAARQRNVTVDDVQQVPQQAAKPMSAAERAALEYAANLSGKSNKTAAAATTATATNDSDYRTEGDLSDAEKDRAIAAILKRFMDEWEATLAARPDSESSTPQGRVATATFAQCNAQITPLLRVLATGGLHDEIRQHLFTICVHMERKEYMKAHDAYILLAIGKAAWPMGVTMVGIHERAGRSKIYDNKTAHILNDETQRKYIQSVKRLLSFAQSKVSDKAVSNGFVLSDENERH
jgi:pre-mRNA-splicing factor 18